MSFLAISAWSSGEVSGSWYWAMGKHAANALGSASTSSFAASRKIAPTDVVMGVRTGRRASSQGPRKTGLTLIRACATLPPTDSQRGLAAS